MARDPIIDSDHYPILVERWDVEHPSDAAVCVRCHADFKWKPDMGLPDELGRQHAGCGGDIVMKFDEGERCENCGVLGHWTVVFKTGCCSRRCQLQIEHLKTLTPTKGPR